jgi:hypothetical protein
VFVTDALSGWADAFLVCNPSDCNVPQEFVARLLQAR